MRTLALGTAAICALLACTPHPARVPASAPSTYAGADGAAGIDEFERQMVFKALTDQSFQVQLSPEMIVRKVRYAGADKFVVPAYLFSPRDTTVKHAAVIMVHGGVHGDLDDSYVWQIRSLVSEGYVVVAPEYRGSTGYGRAHYDAIDYGGKEVEDVINARAYLATFVPWADTARVGMLGWSHGGFITLHSIFRRPELFKVAVAHVPVADLVSRMASHSPGYRKIFAAQPGFGGPVETHLQNYIARSPVSHARELKTPLLVHAADNDQDVFIEENHHLRDSMVVAGKDKAGLYTYREWHDPPGGHAFSRLNTPEALDSWTESTAFLRRYLSPQSRSALR